MASKTALNAANLEALGAARLARLLMEVSEGDAAVQRRLRLELAAGQSAGEVARAVRRRLGQVGRARGYVDWYRRRPVIEDLDAHRRAVAEAVAPQDPTEALDLMWRLLELAGPAHERCDDSDGLVGDLFRDALAGLGEIAAAARPDPEGLAEHALGALQDNGYAQYDGLVAALAPALGEPGLTHLENHLRAWAALPAEAPLADDGAARRTGSGAGTDDAEPSARALRERRGAARIALSDIADARGDADGFAAQFDEGARRAPAIAGAIAHRLLGAGRAADALAALDGAEVSRWLEPPLEWHDARLEALDALGRDAEAQAARWARFEAALSEADLRGYLERLHDFEDIEAEEQALGLITQHPDALAALSFFVHWPAHERAAALVLSRAGELDGNAYWVLTPAAEALAERHPLAATLALRAMIDFSLEHARSSRYRHAARHLVECGHLAPRVADWGPAPRTRPTSPGCGPGTGARRASGPRWRMRRGDRGEGPCHMRTVAASSPCRPIARRPGAAPRSVVRSHVGGLRPRGGVDAPTCRRTDYPSRRPRPSGPCPRPDRLGRRASSRRCRSRRRPPP